MLIISWNVAGLKPALNKIVSDYAPPPAPSSSRKKPSSADGGGSHAAVSNYLARHGSPAILCLQEHKIPPSQLSSRSEPHRCSSVPGYESFWSCATLPGCRGFNGVVTYVKEGLVSGASSTPLGDPDLDGQGRCVMTDHGRFVVFNVYVPMHRDREALVRKMRVLRALGNAMDRQRALGKKVILVGDMNLKADKRDVVRRARVVEVDRILAEAADRDDGDGPAGGEPSEPPSFPQWKRDVVRNWDRIVSALGTIEAVPRKTTNPTTKETFDRFRARVRLGPGGSQYVSLGQHEDTPEEALGCYGLSEVSYDDPSSGESVVIRNRNALSVDVLAELMNKVCGARWDDETVRAVGDSDSAGINPACPAHRWMRCLLDGDGGGGAGKGEGRRMVDVFRNFYPKAEGRFTCWHQMKGLSKDEGAGATGRTDLDELGDAAALSATTASGLFEGGGYGGGGIATATRRALDSQFLGGPHTGIVYTPPSYSDHVAISLLMREGFGGEYCRTAGGGALELGTDPETKKAQPHKRQRSIASFFGSTAKAANSAGEKKRKQPTASGSKGANPKKDKKSLHSFFGKQNTGSKK
ncbi:hypothetical protein THAOC_19533 [Thalassiosira oceanica]|uniref:Endonuclease/exonuclease/phosphatase domain-containing protein n=1 Tax=Thalassiosira oceanica TaxID=159749 RepID=K0S5L8_THAOC|nr:hypothetical protein THAOC_19533 [Thalassiosira oceanica]|eukprot:EJK60164.1 hypothetical protein THAOC_19533 [Thalassiosira oceanica]